MGEGGEGGREVSLCLCVSMTLCLCVCLTVRLCVSVSLCLCVSVSLCFLSPTWHAMAAQYQRATGTYVSMTLSLCV